MIFSWGNNMSNWPLSVAYFTIFVIIIYLLFNSLANYNYYLPSFHSLVKLRTCSFRPSTCQYFIGNVSTFSILSTWIDSKPWNLFSIKGLLYFALLLELGKLFVLLLVFLIKKSMIKFVSLLALAFSLPIYRDMLL